MAIKRTQMNEIKANFIEATQVTIKEALCLDFIGESKEGFIFKNEDGDALVIRLVAKKDDFDVADAIAEREEQLVKAKAKEEEMKVKREKREAEKAKKEADKEKTKQLKKEAKEIEHTETFETGNINDSKSETEFEL